MAKVGVVAIGRNEGFRLEACLSSIGGVPAVYVDSGSSDGSVALAGKLGARCVELDMSRPFTAARARNAGFERLIFDYPQLEFVMFVDGDCSLDPSWLDLAVAHLEAHPDLGVVCGRRKERFPERSIYNLLCDIEWDTPIGRAKACGGDAVYRVDVLRELGGFDPTFIAGEEPELCFRIRSSGRGVDRIDAAMTYHDAAMTRFRQWWKRTERSGYAYFLNAHKHGRSSSENFRLKEVVSILAWFGGAVGFILASVIFASPLPLAVLLLVLIVQYVRIERRQVSLRKKYGAQASKVYALSVLAGKLPQAFGVLKGALNVLRSKQHTLLEYK